MTITKPINHVKQVGDKLTRNQRITFILLLGGLMSLMPFSIDPYLPSFPAIAKHFDVSRASVQFTLTGVTIGFAIGQLLAGPLSDALGRRRPLLFANTFFVVGALGSCFAPNIEAFFCLRLLMALGAAASAVVSSAVVRDLYVGSPMIKMLSRVFFIQGLAPIAGPILGAQLLKILSWQQVFLFFGGFAVLILLLTSKFLVETLHSNKRRVKGFDGMAGRFRAVLRDRIYVGLLIVSVVQTIALFSYLNVFSFLYQQGFHISLENFGWFFAMNSACSWAGVQLASKLARSFPPQWILLITLVLATFVGFGLLVAGLTNGPFALVAALLAAFMLVFGATITPISAISLAQHGSEAGTAASLMGVLNFVVTSLVSPLYGYLTLTTSAGVGGVIAGCYVVALLSMIFIVRPSTVPVMAR